MNDVVLYNKCNILQRTGAIKLLEEYNNIIQWKKDALILDIGCGDGSLTANVLKRTIPDCKMVMGCDINKDMVDFAKANYSSEDINFIVLDIAGEVPGSLRGKFDHAFSFFVLHWVKNQEIAFKNIYDLLGNDGDCLLIVVGQAALYDGFRDLAQSKKWRGLLEENEKYVSPYHDGEDSVSELKEMLLKIGFSTVDINEKPVAFSHDNEDSFRGSLRALVPFNIPEEQFDDFLDDLAYAMQEGDHKKYNLEKSSSDLTFNFNNIAIYIKK